MTASTNLGKVAMIPKGIWDNQTAYTKLNVVTLGGSSYLAVQDVPAGTSVSNTTYWQLIAERGSTGGISQLADAFSTLTQYYAGDYCSYNDDIYRFVNAHSGEWDENDVVLTTIAEELTQKLTEEQVESILEEGTILKATQLETGRDIQTDLGSDTPAEFDGTSDITPGVTGVLPVIHGGTGNTNGTVDTLTTPRAVRVNLESSTSASFNGSADIAPGVDGILPKAHGGTGNANGTADKLTTARTIRTNLASTSTGSFDGSANITPGVTGILPVANGGTGNNKGTVSKLTTARTVRTNLASTSAVAFDGSENITPGVSGTLPIANGGTGATSALNAIAKLGVPGGTATALVNNADTELSNFFKTRVNTNYNPGLNSAVGPSYNFMYILQFYYSSGVEDRTATSTRIQIALPVGTSDKKIAFRTYVTGTGWSAWRVLTAS